MHHSDCFHSQDLIYWLVLLYLFWIIKKAIYKLLFCFGVIWEILQKVIEQNKTNLTTVVRSKSQLANPLHSTSAGFAGTPSAPVRCHVHQATRSIRKRLSARAMAMGMKGADCTALGELKPKARGAQARTGRVQLPDSNLAPRCA